MGNMLKENVIDLTFNCTPKSSNNLRRIPAFQDTILLTVPNLFSVNHLLAEAALSSHDVISKSFKPSLILQGIR